jgi:hypothetical protein
VGFPGQQYHAHKIRHRGLARLRNGVAPESTSEEEHDCDVEHALADRRWGMEGRYREERGEAGEDRGGRE